MPTTTAVAAKINCNTVTELTGWTKKKRGGEATVPSLVHFVKYTLTDY
jgi:hypothetical protein